MKKISWGIVSTGNIANQFAQGLSQLEDSDIKAVCSRSEEKAGEFAKVYGIPRCYDSTEKMAKDKDIDIVYIGTPNNCHVGEVSFFLDSGLNVLCEKPMGLNAAETDSMIMKARSNNLFLMEGMWTRFFPPVLKAHDWIKEGLIGRPLMLFANFGYNGVSLKDEWRFDQKMGGGALLDVGIYPLALAFSVFGSDYESISGSCYLEDGVDHYNSFTLSYPTGQIAICSSSITVLTDNRAIIECENGRIIIHDNWWRPTKSELFLSSGDFFEYGGERVSFDSPYEASGFQFEAAAVNDCLRKGQTECRLMPLSESLLIAKAMDKLKQSWG